MSCLFSEIIECNTHFLLLLNMFSEIDFFINKHNNTLTNLK